METQSTEELHSITGIVYQVSMRGSKEHFHFFPVVF